MGKTTNFDPEKAAEQRKAEMKDYRKAGKGCAGCLWFRAVSKFTGYHGEVSALLGE